MSVCQFAHTPTFWLFSATMTTNEKSYIPRATLYMSLTSTRNKAYFKASLTVTPSGVSSDRKLNKTIIINIIPIH